MLTLFSDLPFSAARQPGMPQDAETQQRNREEKTTAVGRSFKGKCPQPKTQPKTAATQTSNIFHKA